MTWIPGGRDGAVRVWDTRQSDYPVARMEPQEGEAKRDCWAVAFGRLLDICLVRNHQWCYAYGPTGGQAGKQFSQYYNCDWLIIMAFVAGFY